MRKIEGKVICIISLNMSRFLRSRILFFLLCSGTVLTLVSFPAIAQENSSIDKVDALEIFINSLWLVIAGALVFLMNAGFALLEAGSCSQKSLINVLAKNAVVFCVATLAFWLLGFSAMFGDGVNFSDSQRSNCSPSSQNAASTYSYIGNWNFAFQLPFPTLEITEGQVSEDGGTNPLGFPSEGFSCLKEELWPNRSFASIFFFQLVFAGTAATIVSGAVVERIKFWAFVPFSFALTSIIYPLAGHWVWGPFGWLYELDFRDFAGSTVVHSVGGTAALVGACLLGPRWTRFNYDPQTEIELRDSGGNTIKYEAPEKFKKNLTTPHNLGFLTLGGLILWLGWIGFNGGSTPQLSLVPHIVATTLVASAAGGMVAISMVQWNATGDPSLGTFVNGILGGLVAITASSAYVDLREAFLIGFVSGFIVVFGEQFVLPRLKIDDPVGAIPVHLGCGFWGTIAVAFVNSSSPLYNVKNTLLLERIGIFWVQLVGWLIVCIFAAMLSFLFWLIIGWFLFAIESASSQQKVTLQNKGTQLGIFRRLFLWGRYGIRASVKDEYVGSYSFFSDPHRKERKTELEKHRVRD